MSKNQVAENYEAYVTKYKNDLESKHTGKVALLHNGALIQVFDSYDDAYWHGVDEYELGNFSVQEIGSRPAQLGALSFALR